MSDEDTARKESTSYFQELRKDVKKQSRRAMSFVEIAALLGLSFYVYETTRTNDLTQRGLEETVKHFEQSERPYLWPSEMQPVGPTSIPASLNRKMQIKVQIADYGTSPAVSERPFGNILFGPNALTQADAWFKQADQMPESERVTEPTFIRPDKEAPLFHIVESKRPVTQADVDFAAATNDVVYVLALRLYYTDVRNTLHYSDVCAYSIKDKPVAPQQLTACQKHNEAK